MSHPILQFFAKPDTVDLEGLRAYLDGLDHPARLEATRHRVGVVLEHHGRPGRVERIDADERALDETR